MASTGLRFLGLCCLMLLLQKSSARQFIVGGSAGWTVPQNTATNSYNQWAENNRFQIGDSLLFTYNSGQDSVLEVSKENYDSCNPTSPISTFTDGHTVYNFTRSGAHYFISGNKDNCQKNEKLVVVVLADRSKTTTSPPPSPTPAGSPPSETATPTPSPKGHKNAASPAFISPIGYIGAFFFASSLVLVL